MRKTLAAILFLIPTSVFAGPVLTAIDGDTVKSKTVVYRLQHYDAPEIGHAKCDKEKALGLQAKTYMQQLLTGKYNIYSSGKKDKYGRTLARLIVNRKSTDKLFIAKGLGVPYEGKGPKKDWCVE